MAKLTQIIPAANFETVGTRIGLVLATELDYQQELNPNADTSPTVWKDRAVPFNYEELPAINICLATGEYSNKDQTQADGAYSYMVDIYAKAASTLDEEADTIEHGDKLAYSHLQRMIAMCRAILENPQYRTLDFTPPSLKRVMVQGFEIGDIKPEDANYSVRARLRFEVHVPEYVELKEGLPLTSHYTNILLHDTDKGYRYVWSTQAVVFANQAGTGFTLPPQYAHLQVAIIFDKTQPFSSGFTQDGAVVLMTNGNTFSPGQQLDIKLVLGDNTAVITATTTGNTITLPTSFANIPVAAFFDEDQCYLLGNGFTRSGLVLTFTGGNTVASGRSYTILYGNTVALITATAGNIFTIPASITDLSVVCDGSQAYNSTQFTRTTTTGTMTNEVTFSNGQIIALIGR